MKKNYFPSLVKIFSSKPDAVAEINGSNTYPNIKGNVWFYSTAKGVLVVADIIGLPNLQSNCADPIFAFHIHSGESCTGNSTDPFANAGMHYNPNDCMHPYHAGDLPPLFSANGYAFCVVLTNRFQLYEVIGKTIIIHSNPDDFTSQPSGNAGTKIACGKIIRH